MIVKKAVADGFFIAIFYRCDTIICMKQYDTIIIGAGASGLKAAAELHKRKKSILVLDMGANPARKVAISGGGNCNFTNTNANYTHYFGQNPDFVRSALAQFSPNDTLNWVKAHGIKYVEKESGRYFCADGADKIIDALIKDIGNTEIKYNFAVTDVYKENDIFVTKTNNGQFTSDSLIVATGGLSYPHLGVSNLGHIIAKKFGHKIIPVSVALCAIKTKCFTPELAGISTKAEIILNKRKIWDDLLFTHFGLGGPAIYRATLSDISKIVINFTPHINVFEKLHNAKQTNGRKNIANILGEFLPNKLARFFTNNDNRNIADCKDSELKNIADTIEHFEITDAQKIGMQSAEITMGGIDTNDISSKTMESKICHGLFFTGEVLDITGDLGGFNLQWAFSSGIVAGKNA